MKLSRKWLSEFVDIEASDREYDEAMTLSGSKVELTEDMGAGIVNVVVGRILSLEKHPHADKLQICRVDVGADSPLQIATGAKNVAPEDLVPVALDGSVLPGGVRIDAGELRGVASLGMLCSVKELGLTIHDVPYAVEDGILILQEPCSPGQDIREVLGLDDHVVEFEITPNRPDCLSVIGLARETSAVFGKPLHLHEPKVKAGCGSLEKLLAVEIRDPDLCPRYTARMVKNVKIAPSPAWMRERLRASGVRPINNIVDITNYVMLEYGQPMHAFDFACVNGGRIVVRRAAPGEELETLDGTRRRLTPGMLVIADEHRPVGVAGVMGGANSEITGSTAAVVFESANFNGTSIRQTAVALGMRTDASSRFEKGLDPQGTLPAVQRACELVELLGAGEVLDSVIDVKAADFPATVLSLDAERINRLLGTEIPAPEMAQYLRSLGFAVTGDRVEVPSWRSDIEHYSDLAEEVARLYGYNLLPTTMMRGETTQGGFSDVQRARRLAGTLCRGMGYSEILTYSFVSPSCFDKIRLPASSPLRNAIRILNPLGEDTGIMRTTALPSMMETLSRNYSYRNPSARLYELASVYLPREGETLPEERQLLLLGGYGDMDFFELKGAVEAVLANMNIRGVTFAAEAEHSSYHPGRCASVSAGGVSLGMLGQIHPLVTEEYGMDTPAYAAQLDFPAMLACRAPEARYVPLPRFPSVSRDIAVVCDASIPVAVLESCIARGAAGLLKEVRLFDIYTGSPVPAGKKSVAFSLTLRSDDRTLTDAEADVDVRIILNLLHRELGAVLR